MSISPVYSKTIAVPETVIDENGRVNNVAYVQWMQDIITRPSAVQVPCRRLAQPGWRART